MAIIDAAQVDTVLGPLTRQHGKVYKVLMLNGASQEVPVEEGERLARYLKEEQTKRTAGVQGGQ